MPNESNGWVPKVTGFVPVKNDDGDDKVDYKWDTKFNSEFLTFGMNDKLVSNEDEFTNHGRTGKILPFMNEKKDYTINFKLD